MREIKFRAWDGAAMWYPETLTADNNNTTLSFYNPLKGIRWGLYESRYENRLASGEYHKLMQYTGLKDSKGAEIYEGDIVEWQDSTGTAIYPNYITVKETVEFKGGSFYPVCMMHGGEFEIIGNIYENPDLL